MPSRFYVLLLFDVFRSLGVSNAPGETLAAFLKHFPFILLYEILSLNGNSCIIISEGVSGG